MFNNKQYADNKVIFAGIPDRLHQLLENILDSGDQNGLKRNTSKIKVMVISRNRNLRASI